MTAPPTQPTDLITRATTHHRELLAHCYRMTGSAHDAEDLVQETYLRAWRAHDQFEGRCSLRTWLFTIATRVCLTALATRARRPLPLGLGQPPTHPDADLPIPENPHWIEPLPDPADLTATRDTVRLAFAAALQHLPPRQRAVLLLRDVLHWRSAEVATTLGTTTDAVNSALTRARTRLRDLDCHPDHPADPPTPHQRDLLRRYVEAMTAKDIPTLITLFTEDAVWEMPPHPVWYQGPHHIAHHLQHRCPGGPGDLHLTPTRANGQPAFALYLRHRTGRFTPFAIQLLTTTHAGITHAVTFLDPTLFPLFRLPDHPR
ncbi:RNA polymerase subunit sigma-70 [Actinoalloteichus sp. AHMU CJ021]|uniref:RNA polymerase sigma factor n=3 Tax=Actinoalloteichus cyanogriseus TaxID=2893586 RepID=A0ABT1JE43_ACTCY|nr:sigma-70 family RNA polymerase sigma factor [Actinoalloteichus caeruleus]AUS81009.1 RNA polymerase subunit sigma-70 [Actinoalloteichus sp. AHMU CJ021]MCP2330479.1 RNA polymerase sigma-70 factor, ECF subfamily [Actinoalloteichus caeruleus DSM 43889]